MNRTSIIAVIALVVALGVGVVVGVVVSDTDSSDASESVLFVQQATNGEYTPGPDSTDATLVLHGVSSRTDYFTDRPGRVAGTVSTAAFSASDDVFADDPPNAAIVVGGLDRALDTEQAFFVELRSPVYDAATSTITYAVRPLSEPTGAGLTNFSAREGALPAAFTDASLFIDAGELPVDATSADVATASTTTTTTAPPPLELFHAGVEVLVEDASGGVAGTTVLVSCERCDGFLPHPLVTDSSGRVTFVVDLEGLPSALVSVATATAAAQVMVQPGVYVTAVLDQS